MKNKLEEIFEQGQSDNFSIKINGNGYESIIRYGTKIIKDIQSGNVSILHCYNDSDYYSKMNICDLSDFIKFGWKKGCKLMSLKKHKRKIIIIQKKLDEEIVKDSSKKEIERLTYLRDHSKNKIEKLSEKLNI